MSRIDAGFTHLLLFGQCAHQNAHGPLPIPLGQKYWIDKIPHGQREPKRKGLFISAGATKGKKLFDGTLLTIKYFFDVLDVELWKALLYRGLDFEADALTHPDYLQEAHEAGREFASILA